MTLDERRNKLLEAWVEAFDHEKPELDRLRIRTRVLAAHQLAETSSARQWWLWASLPLCATALALVLVAKVYWPTSTSFTVSGQRGDVGEWLATQTTEQLTLDFSEGTRVELQGGSRGRVDAVTPRGARVTIERGSLSAQVTHRSDTSWQFGAGPFEVIVVGTALDVSWNPEVGKFELGVQRGSVFVRGPFLQSRQEVRAGERCFVDLGRKSMELVQVAHEDRGFSPQAPAAALPPPADTEVSADPADVPAPGAEAKVAGRPAPPSWLTLERSGKHSAALAAAEASGLARIYQTASAEELLDLARAARLAGRTDIEHDALIACRHHYKGQASAARAAYLLGRATDPGEAAGWFETYIREQPTGVLAREASGRLIESEERAGHLSAAREAASRYLANYPDGPHATLARQVLASNRGDGG